MVMQSADGTIMSQREMQWAFNQSTRGLMRSHHKNNSLSYMTQSQHHRFQRMKEGLWGESFRQNPLGTDRAPSKLDTKPSMVGSTTLYGKTTQPAKSPMSHHVTEEMDSVNSSRAGQSMMAPIKLENQ